jgi:hypothetical protein
MATVQLTSNLLNQKHTRAWVIADHLRTLHDGRYAQRVVCFTCGNAAKHLRTQGLDVLEVGPRGSLQTTAWWRQWEIERVWPDRFDATSGHLPLWLMQRIGTNMLSEVGLDPQQVYGVPSGSGETLCCLALADPGLQLVAQYDDSAPETTYNSPAPLNGLVERLAVGIERKG